MTERVVTTEYERKMLIRFLEGIKLPFTANVATGKHRTVAQNRLQRKWMQEIAEHLDGHTAEEIRGYCKLHLGVPILREENPDFRAKYDAIIKPMPYEHKIAAMMEPLDFPITRLMSTKQKTAYLDTVQKHFAERGIILTNPDDQGREFAA